MRYAVAGLALGFLGASYAKNRSAIGFNVTLRTWHARLFLWRQYNLARAKTARISMADTFPVSWVDGEADSDLYDWEDDGYGEW